MMTFWSWLPNLPREVSEVVLVAAVWDAAADAATACCCCYYYKLLLPVLLLSSLHAVLMQNVEPKLSEAELMSLPNCAPSVASLRATGALF